MGPVLPLPVEVSVLPVPLVVPLLEPVPSVMLLLPVPLVVPVLPVAPVPLLEPMLLLPLPLLPLVCANTKVAVMQSTAKVRISIFVEVRYIGCLLYLL